MRKVILLVVLMAIVFTTADAKTHRRNTSKLLVEKAFNPGAHIADGKNVKSSNPNLVKIRQAQRLQPILSGSKQLHHSSSLKLLNSSPINTAVKSVPESLIGTFQFKGVSYFSGGFITGETVIKADNVNQKKIWITNLIPGASNQDVYGTLSTDQKTISIPQGQQIYVEGSDKATLTIYDSSDPISGQFDSSTGVITITSDLWGAEFPDGYLELYSGTVTYTRADMLPPVASYLQPQGGLFLGLDPDTWGSYYSSCIISSPFVQWNWKNSNIEEDVAYSWSYADSITGKKITSDQDSLLMDSGEDYYTTPKLTATNKQGRSSSFTLGADYQNKDYPSYTSAGGDAVWLGFDPNCDYSVANLDYGLTYFSYGEDSYYFGTGASKFSDANYESLLVYYDEPQSTLYFEGVNVYLFVFNAPDDIPFTMNVVLADKNAEGNSVKGKVIASSTITAKDVVAIKNDNQEVVGYTMKFTKFLAKDEDGFEIVNEDFQMDKAFFLELTGFNVDGVTLAVCTEEINPTNGESRSNFMVKGDNSIYFWDNYRQTMYFNLSGMSYSYISLSESGIYDDKSGGTYNIDAFPFFDTLYFDKAVVPDWLNIEIVDEEYSDTKWGATVKVTIDPLPANGDPRFYDLVLHTVAATQVLHINQACQVSTDEIKKARTAFAFKNEQGFLIKYPNEMNSLTVYSVTGAFVGRYDLPVTGSYQLHGSALSNGLYILKLQGSKGTETIKVVKD
jgi:hypothetical protein